MQPWKKRDRVDTRCDELWTYDHWVWDGYAWDDVSGEWVDDQHYCWGRSPCSYCEWLDDEELALARLVRDAQTRTEIGDVVRITLPSAQP